MRIASDVGGTFTDLVYLDTDERRRFAQVSHEYLIEQVQEQALTGLANGAELNFNHPVKELIWTLRNESNGTTAGRCQSFGAAECYFTASPVSIDTFGGNWKLVLNGHDRFKERDSKYFTRTQVWEHHTGYGGVTIADSIAVYSFALKPEEHQPSGTCNFSRIDNARLQLKHKTSHATNATTSTLHLFAVNYNVLRVMSGMAGLAYSN